jgi:hypothetical protein
MNERDGLAVLDRRMREASGELRRVVDAAINERRSNDTTPISRSATSGDLAPVISLDGSTPPVRRRRRWPWAAAAAAVVAAVGVAGVIVVGDGGRDDDDGAPPATATATDQPFLVPRWLPPGWGPTLAVRNPELSEPSAMATVYGSATIMDPDSDLITIVRVDTAQPLDSAGSGVVDVAGHDATIERDGETWTVTVPVGGQTLLVTGRGVTRDEILGVAAAAAESRPVEPELPGGLEEIAAGSLDAVGEPGVDSLILRYGTDAGAETVSVAQRPGRRSELGLLLMMLPGPATVTEVTVRDQRGIRATWDESSGLDGVTDIVQWIEPPGLLVTVWVDGLADEPLDRFIEAMRESTTNEIDELVETYPEPADGSGEVVQDDGGVSDEANPGPEASGHVDSESRAADGIIVAEGGRGDSHWVVTAEAAEGSTWVNYEDANQSFGFAAAGPSEPATTLEATTSPRPDDRGAIAVIGVADSAIVEVVVEAAGRPPFPVELYRHDELTHPVIVGFVPRPYRNGELVGRDRRGREVARTPLEH